MVCPAILTGVNFLATTFAHVDCQGRTIGAYGYGALSDPGSTITLALTGLLTLFIALFGIRLMLGYPTKGSDVIGGIIRVGLMLTLATSWPAWRVVGYDLVMDGPAEIARAIGGASALPGSDGAIAQRLQNVDDGLVAMTTYGTGRVSGDGADNSDRWGRFRGIALADDTGFGWGRVVFLAGAIGPYAVTRLSAGLLLALAPLMAGLLLFGGTFSLFAGWLRGLAFSALGALGLFVIEGVELAVLDPWVADVLAQRGSTTPTPSAPTELVVLALAFVVAKLGLLFVIARMVFHAHLEGGRVSVAPDRLRGTILRESENRAVLMNRAGGNGPPTRAVAVADAVLTAMRREEAGGLSAVAMPGDAHGAVRGGMGQLKAEIRSAAPDVLGSGFRRTHRRTSLASEMRDRKL